MAPRFRKKDESVEAGFRRIALAEIDETLAIIDDRGRTETDKVHKVRRQIKALRALLRLVRPAFGRFRKENRKFRDMARALAHLRDAKVMLDTFDAITGTQKGRVLSRGLLTVRERLGTDRGAQADLRQLLEKTRNRLVKARGRAEKWTLDGGGWQVIGKGLSRTYDHARDAMDETLESHDAEASHEWRKGVKYHGAQMRLLRKMKPLSLRKREKVAARLGDVLGARHDIDMFLDTVAQAPARYGDVITVTQLAGLARLHSARLDRRARRLGQALFEDKAEKLARDWGAWWEEWQP
ncbi:MAG: CHAD domain-containing protein [Sphingobium sp.]|nr:CHAD domain-containing protein [Sphingobium sp.]